MGKKRRAPVEQAVNENTYSLYFTGAEQGARTYEGKGGSKRATGEKPSKHPNPQNQQEKEAYTTFFYPHLTFKRPSHLKSLQFVLSFYTFT